MAALPFCPHFRVFPTPVGMFHFQILLGAVLQRFPHARGDVPAPTSTRAYQIAFSPRPWGCSALMVARQLLQEPIDSSSERDLQFSPRPWGCSSSCLELVLTQLVFPTPVGMFRRKILSHILRKSFPHARGDVPRNSSQSAVLDWFSPRPWGCSANLRSAQLEELVFPTPVGMFRERNGP